MFQIATIQRLKMARYISTVIVLLLLIAGVTIPLHLVGVNSVYSQADDSQTPSDVNVVGISDFGGFEFAGEPIDFGQFSADSSEFAGPVEFDFGGFFAVFETSQLFDTAGGDFGDFAEVFGSFEDFGGEFNDILEFGGSFSDLGGFFNRSNETLEAFGLAKDLGPGDLDGIFAYDLIQDLDFFGFHELGADIVGILLSSAEGAGDLGVIRAEQWAGVLGALETNNISDLSDALLDDALNAMQDRDFLLLPPAAAAALFEATVLKVEDGLGLSFADRLTVYGDDVLGMLGAADHDFFFANRDKMGDIFESIDFQTLDLETSAASGDDIGVMLEAMGDKLGDQDSEAVSAAIGHMGVGDFGEWTGEAALEVIESLGLERVQELAQYESIIGSFKPDQVGFLGQDLTNIIGALDFRSHENLLGGFAEGALNTLTRDQLIGFGGTGKLVGLVNSAGAEGIVGMADDLMDAIFTGVERNEVGMFDADTFGSLTGVLAEATLSGYPEDFQDAILEAMEANLFGSGGVSFAGIRGAFTAFGPLADAIDTVEVDGEETYSSLLVDGSSSLQEGAVEFFIAGLSGSE